MDADDAGEVKSDAICRFGNERHSLLSACGWIMRLRGPSFQGKEDDMLMTMTRRVALALAGTPATIRSNPALATIATPA